MLMTFDKGYFILSQCISPLPNFEKIDAQTFRTNSLKTAIDYRQYADKKAAKVFDRVLNKEYFDIDVPLLLPIELHSFLDPHQVRGVAWVLSRSRSYLAHAPGAGKTLQAIAASILCKGSGPVLFIVPPGLTVNWEREIWKWTECAGILPSISIVPQSPKQDLIAWRAEFIICPDSMLAKDWVYKNLLALPFKFIAVDEASRFKDHETQRAAALFGGRRNGVTYPGLIYKARHVVLLDGSPMPNRPMELWAPTYAMDPEAIDFLSQHEFGLRYCGATVNPWGAWEYKYSSNEDELKEKLQRNFMHVVNEDELSHPERLRSIVFMSEDPRTAEMKEWDKKNLNKIDFSSLSEDASQGELATMRRELGLRKIPWIIEYVKERLLKNESILLFAWHREVCTALSEILCRFASTGLVMGGTKPQEREEIFKKFQEGRVKVIVGNISAMGRGHNLQKADRVIFGEYSWTDETNKQCEKRASRKGSSKKFVRCDYIAAPNTLDEPVLNAVFTKARNTKRIIG